MIWKDIALGTIISGFITVLVPTTFWQILFLRSTDVNPIVRSTENAIVGPLVSVISFICSVGNIPLASVLYKSGIGFGGAVSFIFADLIIIPMILVYRKYFGLKLALWIFGIFYASMVIAGLAVESLFSVIGWVPQSTPGSAMLMEHGMFAINYTFWLNLVFLAIAAIIFAISKMGPAQKTSAEMVHSM